MKKEECMSRTELVRCLAAVERERDTLLDRVEKENPFCPKRHQNRLRQLQHLQETVIPAYEEALENA